MAAAYPGIEDLTGKVDVELDPCGAGGFGIIRRGRIRDTGEDVAIKTLNIFPKTNLEKKKADRKLRNELQICAQINHPNVLKLRGHICNQESGIISMVLPWKDGGDLNHYFEANRYISLKERFRILLDVAEGLKYLHEWNGLEPVTTNAIIHGDLSGGNILFDQAGTACISDFGLSTVVHETSRSSKYTASIHPGNMLYRPPEYCSGEAHLRKPSKRGDVYSFGTIVYQLLSGNPPYQARSQPAGWYMNPKRWRWPKRNDKITDDAHWKFICSCWDRDPDRRPTIQEIVEDVRLFYEQAEVSPKMPVIPDFPNPSQYSMYLLHIPKDATHLEVLHFIHRHHLDRTSSHSGRPTTGGVEGSLTPQDYCPFCPNFIFISTKGSACAIFDKSDQIFRDHAISGCSRKKWSLDQKGLPIILCRGWTDKDQYGKGSGMLVTWTRGDVVNDPLLPPSLKPEVVPFLPDRCFVLRCSHPEYLLESVSKNRWRTNQWNELILNQAFSSSQNVYFIVSVNNPQNLRKTQRNKFNEHKSSGAKAKGKKHSVFGIAKMQGLIPQSTRSEKFNQVQKDKIVEMLPSLGEEFELQWIRHGLSSLLLEELPGNDLKESWGPLLSARDGTEVPTDIFHTLQSLWPDSHSAFDLLSSVGSNEEGIVEIDFSTWK